MDSFTHFVIFASSLLLYESVLFLVKLCISDSPTPQSHSPPCFPEAVT